MVREHGSLTKDAETNQAAWEAARGAAYGGVKVREFGLGLHVLSSGTCLISRCFHVDALSSRSFAFEHSLQFVQFVLSLLLRHRFWLIPYMFPTCYCATASAASRGWPSCETTSRPLTSSFVLIPELDF